MILVTGFARFGERRWNTSGDVLKHLDGLPGVTLGVLPVDRIDALTTVSDLIALHDPVAVLAVGEARSREVAMVETLARGVYDHDGERVDLGPDLPVPPAVLQRLDGIAPLSDDAGTYVCNALLHGLLTQHTERRAAFVHVPARPGRDGLEDLADVLSRCIEALR